LYHAIVSLIAAACLPHSNVSPQFNGHWRPVGKKETLMRYSLLSAIALLSMAGCVPQPTTTTYVTPATSTTTYTPEVRTTVVNPPPGYQTGYVAPAPTATVVTPVAPSGPVMVAPAPTTTVVTAP
jgi:hypothetical protein